MRRRLSQTRVVLPPGKLRRARLPADFDLPQAAVVDRAPSSSAALPLLLAWVVLLAGGVALVEERWDPLAWLRSTVVARVAAPGELADRARARALARTGPTGMTDRMPAGTGNNFDVGVRDQDAAAGQEPGKIVIETGDVQVPEPTTPKRRVWRSLGRHGSAQLDGLGAVPGFASQPPEPPELEPTDIDRELAEDERIEARLLRRQRRVLGQASAERGLGATSEKNRAALVPRPQKVSQPVHTDSGEKRAQQDVFTRKTPTRARASLPAVPKQPISGDRLPQGKTATSGSGATVSRGPGCEAAFRAAEQTIDTERASARDVPPSAYARILNDGAILNGCGVSARAEVNICVTVRAGRALGTTVRVSHGSAASARCVARRVHGKRFPNGQQPDRVRTRFAPQQ